MRMRSFGRLMACVAVCVVMLVLGAACGSTTTSSAPGTTGTTSGTVKTPAQATPNAVGEAPPDPPGIYGATMSALWEGFVLSSEGVGFNWILGEFGASGANNSDAAMLAQLQAIQQQLVQLNTTLAAVNTSVLQQTCDQMYGDIAPLTGRINLLWQEYQTLLGWNAATGQFTNAPLTDTGDISAWIADASGSPSAANPGSSVLSLLTTMQQYLNTGGTGADSSIAACIKAIASKADGSGLPAPGTMDDRTYYASIVQPALDYYYGWQLQAITMYVEMNNYLAWQAAGSPVASPTTVPQTVCGGASTKATAPAPVAPTPSYPSSPPTQTPAAYCELAYNFTVTANQQIRYQWAQGGAPYSSANVLLQNGTNNLWATDLGAFSNAVPNTCPLPLASWPACGPTVAAWNAKPTMDVPYAGYSNWTTANAAQWGPLINPNKTSVVNPSGTTINSTQAAWSAGSLQAWLGTRGFLNVGNWVIFTGDQSNDVPVGYYGDFENPVPTTTDAVCIVVTSYPYAGSGDNGGTGMQPFCSGWGDFAKLSNKPTSHSDPCGSDNSTDLYTACYIPASDYAGFFVLHYGSDSPAGPRFIDSPLWRLDTATASSFHWPVIDVSKVTCSTTEPGATIVNPAGVPSMCGSDLTAYLNIQVPPPT